MKSRLSIDIETYSRRDLTKVGVYSYVEDEGFEILLFAYAFDEEEVQIVDLKLGEELPRRVLLALTDENIEKAAYNATFERICIQRYFGLDLKIQQWRCTAVLAASLGLPSGLDNVAKALNLPIEKMKEGKALIREFSIEGNFPQRILKKDTSLDEEISDFVTFNKVDEISYGFEEQRHEQLEKWELFKEYCKRDVAVERAIRNKLKSYELNEMEQKLYCLDGKINDYGVRVDEKLLRVALHLSRNIEEDRKAEIKAITNLDNPNSTAQIKRWLKDYADIEAKSIATDKVDIIIENTDNTVVKKVLTIRKELTKTSLKKYEAMDRSLCRDGNIRGLLRFYGASRTGRWSGQLVQVQNLPKTDLKDLPLARELLINKRDEELANMYGSISNVLSKLIRTTFIPWENCRFIVSDFSSIEARIIAWLAGEKWRMDVFKTHGKIYEASAAKMFNVPVESIVKDSPLRQKGKIAELALGYGGSVGALKAMGADKMGLCEEELFELVNDWRRENSRIVRLWYAVEEAALKAIKDGVLVKCSFGIQFYFKDGILFVRLPSGRNLAYFGAKIEREERFHKHGITYMGWSVGKGWNTMRTYGGKLAENIVQAIARDCLAEAMLNLDNAGYNIVMHVHDEVVLDVPYDKGSLSEVDQIMSRPIPWAEGLPLRAESFESEYYRK